MKETNKRDQSQSCIIVKKDRVKFQVEYDYISALYLIPCLILQREKKKITDEMPLIRNPISLKKNVCQFRIPFLMKHCVLEMRQKFDGILSIFHEAHSRDKTIESPPIFVECKVGAALITTKQYDWFFFVKYKIINIVRIKFRIMQIPRLSSH